MAEWSPTAGQEQILRWLAKWPEHEDNWHLAVWVAEGCDHAYDTPWASGRLRSLVKRGLVRKDGTGSYYRITEAGRQALRTSKESKDA